MKKHKAFGIILLSAATLFGCHSNNSADLFSFDASKLDKQFKAGETAELSVLNSDKRAIDSVVYYANDQKIASQKNGNPFQYKLGPKMGYQKLKAIVFYDGETTSKEISARLEVISEVKPKYLTYTIVNKFPHDTLSFTEGLEFSRDTLYESTGQEKNSYMRKYDYKSGKVFKQVNLEPQYFGEGITVFNNKITELTWKNKTGFVYDANTWKLLKTFTYTEDVEGWGLTHDDKYMYQTDGTEKIWRMEPETHKLLDYINVYMENAKVPQVNELEYADGKIYANIWQKDAVAVVDPATGAVQGVINFANLRKDVKNKTAEVLNGIAYNPKTKTFFVTGKYWDTMFEVRISE